MTDLTIPRDLDGPCRTLFLALNRYPGIRTGCSCCGHGKTPFQIWFSAESLDDLPPVLYWFDGCHCGFYGWRVIAQTDCGMSPVAFLVEGPTQGETNDADAFAQADEIAGLMQAYLDSPADDA